MSGQDVHLLVTARRRRPKGPNHQGCTIFENLPKMTFSDSEARPDSSSSRSSARLSALLGCKQGMGEGKALVEQLLTSYLMSLY
jgi:hypothetical protein